jgi:hypothetical protein
VKNGFMSDHEIRAAHFEPVHDVCEGVLSELKAHGPAATLCVLPQGPQTIPYLVESR